MPTACWLVSWCPRTWGVLLIHVWQSDKARTTWHDNRAHREAVLASGIGKLAKERTVREYVTDRVELYGRKRR